MEVPPNWRGLTFGQLYSPLVSQTVCRWPHRGWQVWLSERLHAAYGICMGLKLVTMSLYGDLCKHHIKLHGAFGFGFSAMARAHESNSPSLQVPSPGYWGCGGIEPQCHDTHSLRKIPRPETGDGPIIPKPKPEATAERRSKRLS